jgi:hypothetical protein
MGAFKPSFILSDIKKLLQKSTGRSYQPCGGLLGGELHHLFCSQTKSFFLVKKFIYYLDDYLLILCIKVYDGFSAPSLSAAIAMTSMHYDTVSGGVIRPPGGGNITPEQGQRCTSNFISG